MQRPAPSEIPDRPGVYLFRDRHGAVLYVGKAKSLRKRVANYFGVDLAARTLNMVETADAVEWIVTDNEVEAIHLEYTLIQKHQPRFNIRLRDDKSFPFLAITRGEEWPRATVMRGKRRKGTQYFGPYAHAYAIRQTLDLLLRTFPIRTCTNSKMKRHQAQGRPCLLFHIERCSGPCVGEVDPADYQAHLDGLAAFLTGDGDPVARQLRTRMQEASDALEFEQAARFRDQLLSVEKALARQEVASERADDFDLIAIEEDDLEAATVMLTIQKGRVTGRIATVVDKVEDVSSGELVGRMLLQRYGSERPPPEVLVETLPEEPRLWTEWLEARRGTAVSLRVPQRGAKRRLMETARANAGETFARHRLRRQSDHNARARALRSLQDSLDLPEPPLRIEAYDIATIGGRSTVASMVVLEDGLPRRNHYRRFKIRDVEGQDDFASMEEVLRRRLTAYLVERDLPVEERGRFSYPPSLLLVDGGVGQVSRAVKVVDELGLDIPIAGLAKRMEEVYLPGRPDPVRIPRGEEALHLLQRVRDEAHRFANQYHRSLRGKRMVDSILDDVPGVGPARKKALLRRFGSLAKMREASQAELASVVPAGVAAALQAALHGAAPAAGRSR
ncbi:MAG: excinuclease ABC subunit UvrC [Actinobacteria bacterium]|nr:excinuclease ABC subunit UvrC [Actinomycetota bacterium]MBU1494409.1 excinuclease ABC subunit UvrC [Actinomycetota bacterium]